MAVKRIHTSLGGKKMSSLLNRKWNPGGFAKSKKKRLMDPKKKKEKEKNVSLNPTTFQNPEKLGGIPVQQPG